MIRMMKRLFDITLEYKARILVAFVFSFFKAFFAKAPIVLSFYVLIRFQEGRLDGRTCLYVGLAMFISILLQVICQYMSDRLQSATGYEVFAKRRMRLGSHLQKMPMGYFTEGNIGKISSVLSTDMVFIEEHAMMVLADMIGYIFAQCIMFAFLFVMNVYLGLAAIVVYLVILAVAKGMKKEALEDSVKKQEQSESLTRAVLEFVEGIAVIKSFNLLGDKSKELTDNFDESCRKALEFERNYTPWALATQLLYGIGVVIVLAVGIYVASIGMFEYVMLLGLILFIFELFGPLKAFYGNLARLTVMDSCMDRIEAVEKEVELDDSGRDSISAEGVGPEIEFRDVTFAYRDKEVLRHISFALDKDRMLALVGPSGGGKTTVANLIARFWDVKSGAVLVKGKDIRRVPLSDLMKQISMVFQRVYLFKDTVYNNIAMGRTDATRREVEEAAKRARAYDFIMNLPQGFDTVIGEGGASLSGGEMQRISIARCILKDAPIVILDEATSSVDADNESIIQAAISELCKGKTIIVIAHRLKTIANADTILVIKDGEIAESGVHAQLMADKGIYHNLVSVREKAKGWRR